MRWKDLLTPPLIGGTRKLRDNFCGSRDYLFTIRAHFPHSLSKHFTTDHDILLSSTKSPCTEQLDVGFLCCSRVRPLILTDYETQHRLNRSHPHQMPPSHPQPDLSPTASTFLSSTSNPVTARSVRRNLFSAHLSRRPASGSQPPSQSSSQAQPISQPQVPAQAQAQAQTQGQQNHNSQSNLPRLRNPHQRSVSTPSLSPSPPRLSPFNNVNNPTFNPPPAQYHHASIVQPPTPQRAALNESYDPTVSPNRPLSPRSSAALFPNQSIIALNPLTGRPVLPHLPTLPGRLRLTDSDDEDDEHGEAEDEELDEANGHHDPALHSYSSGVEHHGLPAGQYTSLSRHRARRRDPYCHPPPEGADQAHAAAMAAAAEAEAEAEADEERRDRERIERLLREMMARQRARAKGKAPISNASGVSESGRRGDRSHRFRRPQHPADMDVDDHLHDEAASHGYVDRDKGDTESEAEKEELMGLIQASLRREVARADEESWMFGDSAGVGGVGRDEVGIYD